MTKNLPYDRAQRVADEIHHIITSACYNNLSDPRLKGLEITYVKMTKDLQTARVFFYFQNSTDETRRKAQKGLESASGFFKKIIGDEMKLRYMPAIEYFFDETVDLQEKIEEIISKKGAADEKL